METKQETTRDEYAEAFNEMAEAIRTLYNFFPDLKKWALAWALGLPRESITKIIHGWNLEDFNDN